MPQKDPITGCMVMTQAEFWNSEAEREGEGRCGGELMAEYFDEIDQENEKTRLSYYKPDVAMAMFTEQLELYNNGNPADEQIEAPVAVLRVLNVEFRSTFRSTTTKIVALCRRANGRIGKLTAWESNYSGSFYEPPDSEGDLYWGNLPEVTK